MPQSDEVRRYFIDNALYWITEFHVDALRLDAVHAIIDSSARPFVEQLALAVHERARELNREVHVIAESDRNDSRIVRDLEKGGLGLDGTWSDDIHHAVHALLTGEQTGYYADFGGISRLATGLREGFVYSGQYSKYRQRSHGNSARDLPGKRFVVFSQNHDQVGNRMLGERLASLVSFESLKLAAGAILLSPFVPLIFMGEEYGEKAPFLYFVSHSDPALIEAVRKGRAEEFRAFRWEGEPLDPQSKDTFARCKLHWDERNRGSTASCARSTRNCSACGAKSPLSRVSICRVFAQFPTTIARSFLSAARTSGAKRSSRFTLGRSRHVFLFPSRAARGTN